jgi:hypothetical protein
VVSARKAAGREHNVLWLRTAVAGLALIVSAGCATGGSPTLRPAPNKPAIKVVIDNRYGLDARVYMVCRGRDTRRIATVVSHTTRTVTRPACVGSVQFILGFIGSRDSYRTEYIDPMPGDSVVLVIGHYLPYTHLYLRIP